MVVKLPYIVAWMTAIWHSTHLLFYNWQKRELKSRKSKRSSLQNRDKVFFPCRHKRIINRESVDNNGTVESLSICRTWSREALKSLSLNRGAWDKFDRQLSMHRLISEEWKKKKSQHTIRKRQWRYECNRWVRTVQVIHDWHEQRTWGLLFTITYKSSISQEIVHT